MWLFIFLIICIIYLLHYLIQNTEKAKIFNKIPGRPLSPLLGNGIEFICSPEKLFYIARHYSNVYKSTSRVWAGIERIVNVLDPNDLELLLSNPKHITKSFLYEFLHPWLKEGLLTSTGEKWHQRRKILTPAFHFNILRQFCSIFEEQSEKLVKRLEKEIGKDETDILPYITDFALYSICETAMGTDLTKIPDTPSKLYQNSIKTMSHTIIYRFMRFWLRSMYLFSLTTVGKLQKKTVSLLHSFTMNVIRERRSTINLDEITPENVCGDYITGSKKRLAMLDLLLHAESKNNIGENGIREEVDTFMFEGHDTTTMAISFCLMLLANHQDIQEKVVKEIEEVFRDSSNRCITIEKLNKMSYLERCIKEALRLYPSVTMIGRYLTEDLQLRDYLVPAGTTYHIHIFDLHRNANIYPNPDKFDPERFTSENCAKRHPYAYIPFSAGPRNCIGQKYAILEEKAVILSILRKFKLEAVTHPNDIIFTADLILKTRDPIKIKLLLRNP